MSEIRMQAINEDVKVKIFNETRAQLLENAINEFIKGIMIVSIQYQIMESPIGMQYTALVTYVDYPF